MNRPMLVAVRLTGGLGDVLMASPLVQAIDDAFDGQSNMAAYYHTRDAAQFVFAGARWVNAVRGHDELVTRGRWAPDVLIHTGHFPRYVVTNEPALRYAPQAFQDAVAHNTREIASVDGLVKAHPHLDGFWARMWTKGGHNYLDGIGHFSGLPVGRDSWPFLMLDPVDRPTSIPRERYVTVHDGFDNRQSPLAGRATKCWPIEHWETLVRHLKSVLPDDVAIIQVGAGKSRIIPGVDLHYVNRTSLAECAWILKGSSLHIDTDSGLAHLAHVLHTPAVVMFGPTNAAYYGHATNTNMGPKLCGDCWWSTRDWLAKCPRGLATPVCMSSITPFDVAVEAAKRLDHPRIQVTATTASPVTLYPSVTDYKVEADAIATAVGLAPAPVSEHIIDQASGVYIHASKQWEYAHVMREIRKHRWGRGMSPLRVADVGGGRGALAAFMASQGMTVDQFDRDFLWANRPETERDYRRWATSRGYAAKFGSIYNIPAADRSYDVVVCVSVIEHLAEKPTAIQELLRILKPGGICVLTFDLAVDPDRFRDRFRVDVASPDRLREWFHVEHETDYAVQMSADRILADGVAGIPPGMTVAGLTLTRAL